MEFTSNVHRKSQQLLRQLPGELSVFLQDSAACTEHARLFLNAKLCFTPGLWPLNSPDLNPGDYKICHDSATSVPDNSTGCE